MPEDKTISFTGSRKGMTKAQIRKFSELLIEFQEEGSVKIIHGDCIGCDADAHTISLAAGVAVVKRPCYLDQQRAFTEGGEIIAEPDHPLDRNKKIVDDGEELIACPSSYKEEMRSGTWATIRYARRNKKSVTVIWPDGTLSFMT
jgi:hypothetical protein